MSNELRHNTVGAQLSQSEFEDVALHIFNSQATGDILYASSATQLTRLGIGATNTVLVVSGGIPSWSATLAGLTLTAPAINGTVTNPGAALVMPVFGINLAVGSLLYNPTAGAPEIVVFDTTYGQNNGGIIGLGGYHTSPSSGASGFAYLGGLKETAGSGNSDGLFSVWTSHDGSGSAVQKLTIGRSVSTWSNVNHDFGAGTITTGGSACVASFGPAAVASITVKNGLITAIS